MHTLLSVRDDPGARMIAVTDSVLEVFMYLWLETFDPEFLTAEQHAVYAHYQQELPQGNHSYMDLWLEEIYLNPSLTEWYLSTLATLRNTLSIWPPAIDHHFLNGLNIWQRHYVSPFPVMIICHLINDLQWLFYQEGVRPSENFKWFAEGKTEPLP